eukprot:jgi/Galph1/285/GphlegSOOS_G5099.1
MSFQQFYSPSKQQQTSVEKVKREEKKESLSELDELVKTVFEIAKYNQRLGVLLEKSSSKDPSLVPSMLEEAASTKEECMKSIFKGQELLKRLPNSDDFLQHLRQQKVSEDLQSSICTFRQRLEEIKKFQESYNESKNTIFPVVSNVSQLHSKPSSSVGNNKDTVINIPNEKTELSSQQLQLQQNVSYDSTTSEFLKERQNAIHSIETSITEVNSIFKDLAIMVNEQGLQIDQFGTNVENAAIKSEAAVSQLAKAKVRRSKRRRRLLFCFLFLFLFLFLWLLIAAS